MLFLWTSPSGLTQLIGSFARTVQGFGGRLGRREWWRASRAASRRLRAYAQTGPGLPVEDHAVSMPLQDLKARVRQRLLTARWEPRNSTCGADSRLATTGWPSWRLLLLSLSSVSSAYYYWIYFPGRTGPFQAYPAKFDLSTLPDKTVSYFISDQPPAKAGGRRQLRRAGEPDPAGGGNLERRHDLGYSSAFRRVRDLGATPQATPGIDVVFDDEHAPGTLGANFPFDSEGCWRSDQRPRLRADPALQAAIAQRSDSQAAGQLFGRFLPDHRS